MENNVLLVIPPGVRPRVGFELALERAKQDGARLITLAILDPQETARIASRLDSAFMGERVGDRVMAALSREQSVRAEGMLEEMEKCATKAGVEILTMIETGDTGEVCDRVIREHSVSYAVLIAERQSWLTRLLSRSSAVQIPSFEGCEIKVVEEAAEDGIAPDEG